MVRRVRVAGATHVPKVRTIRSAAIRRGVTRSLVPAFSLATALLLTACWPATTTDAASSPENASVSAADGETHGAIDSGRILFGVEGRTPSGSPELRVLQGRELHEVAISDPTFAHAAWAGGDAIVYDIEATQGRQVLHRADYREEAADPPAAVAVAGGANAGASPDGSGVVFAASTPSEGRTAGLSIAPIDGGEAVEVTPGGTGPQLVPYDDYPSYSPDGQQIVYLRVTAESQEGQAMAGAVYIVDVNGGTPRRVSPDLEVPGQPRFSPDGTQILYSAKTSEWRGSLWVVPVSGGEPSELFPVLPHTYAMNADWSPTGTEVVFEWYEDGVDHNELRISKLDGSEMRTIWRGTNGTTAAFPDWAD